MLESDQVLSIRDILRSKRSITESRKIFEACNFKKRKDNKYTENISLRLSHGKTITTY